MEFLKSLKKLLPNVGPEFKEGRKMGEEYAKRDGHEVLRASFKRPSHADASLKARSFTEQLREEGKSEEFIKGFYYGYEYRYKELIDVYQGS
jgi:hypothetical protein